MSNRKTLLVCVAVALAGGAAIVHACGPFFPLQLLDNRLGTLLETPSNSFEYEASHLVNPADRLRAPRQDAKSADKVALAALSASQITTLAVMAQAADGDAAYAQGAGVTEVQRLYAAALVDVSRATQNCPARSGNPESAAGPASSVGATGSAITGASAAGASSAAQPASAATAGLSRCEPDPKLLDRAGARLEALLALPGGMGAPRAADAAARLAEIARMRFDACRRGRGDCAPSMNAARVAYERVRGVASHDAPDPTGLAVQSFGDEALLYLRSASAGQQCDYRSFLNRTQCAAAISPADLKQAINLYAQQASRGSESGVQSLSFIADWALTDAARAVPLVDDPVAQRLLVTYALARVGDMVKDDPNSASEYYGDSDNSFGPSGFADAARGDAAITPNPQLRALVEAIHARGIQQASDADRLASLAYRVGRYDLAATLVTRQDSALANWVKAKLALRRGDIPAAVRLYAAASKAFPTTDASVEPSGALLLKGEQGVLTLARGQYVEALGYLYGAAAAKDSDSIGLGAAVDVGYANDMSYIAERVLTTDELKTFVDAHVQASPVPAGSPEAMPAQPPVGDTLRYLLARRLVRDGRIAQALPYFPADRDPRFTTVSYDANDNPVYTPLESHKLVLAYADALHTARHAWLRNSRARGWFEAATIAKQNGMELMGYEQDPDYANVGGSFDGGSGRQLMSSPQGASAVPATPAARAAAALAGPYVSADEKRRYADTEAKPYARFHYREIAANQAEQAANLLPPRSQAFAAVLCQATTWTVNDNPSRAERLYRRYVKEGAFVNFGGRFGTQCATPDFHEAALFTYEQTWQKIRTSGRGCRKYMVLVALLAVAVAGCGLLWRRRRRVRTM